MINEVLHTKSMQVTLIVILTGMFTTCIAFLTPKATSIGPSSVSSRYVRLDIHDMSRFPEQLMIPNSVKCKTSKTAGRCISQTTLKAVLQVSAEELEKEMTEWDLPLILDVYAVWCGPCLMLKPELEKVAEALEGKCRVLKMDSDDESEMASALNVLGLPTLFYMKDGLMKHKTEGSLPADEILQLADQHLFGGEPPQDPADSLFIDMHR